MTWLNKLALLSIPVWAATVPTAHIDNTRQNSSTQETALTLSNVATGKFGRLGSYAVDGRVNSQVLYIPAVTISSVQHDIIITCTMHNSCYAFDAHNPDSAALWHAGPLATSRTSYPFQGSNTFLYGAEVGCLATPAVDVALGVVFIACTNSTPTWVLYKLNLTTGATVASITITGSVAGTGDPGGGDCVSGGVLSFCPAFALIRPAITIANNNVYLFLSGYDDQRPWHGWAISYDEATLTQQAIFCTTPNGYGGGFWGGGGGPAVDNAGNLYAATGNGSFDGVTAFSDSFLKFGPTLALSDWFTPSDWATIDAEDADLASNRTLLIPNTNLLVGGGKDFRVFLLDTTSMGHLQGSPGGHDPVQVFPSNPSGTVTIFSGSYGMSFWNSNLYVPVTAGTLYSFAFSAGTFNTTPTATDTTSYGFPGRASVATVSGGTSNAILWYTTAASSAYQTQRSGTLRAMNASTLSELWNSDTRSGDALGTLSKFASPTVVNGRVYVATQDNLVQVYGLISASVTRGVSSLRGQSVSR